MGSILFAAELSLVSVKKLEATYSDFFGELAP